MGYLLCVTVSRRGAASWSLRVLDEFVAQWKVRVVALLASLNLLH